VKQALAEGLKAPAAKEKGKAASRAALRAAGYKVTTPSKTKK